MPKRGPATASKQQQNAEKLQQQAPGLLDAPPVLQLRANVGGRPESQRGHHLTPLGAIQKVERDHAGRDCSRQSDQFAQAEIQK